MFDRTVNAKGMKTKDSQETVKAFSSMITKKNGPKKIWVDKGTEFAGTFKKFLLLRGYKFTLQWARLRRLLLNVQYDYWKNSLPLHGRFWIQVYTQNTSIITTLTSRRISSIDMRPNTVKNCDFMSILYVNLYENSRNLRSKLVIECESQSMTCLFAKVTSRSLHEKFLKL